MCEAAVSRSDSDALGALSLGRDPETLEHSSVGVGHFLFEPATAALDNASRAEILRVTGEQHFRQATS